MDTILIFALVALINVMLSTGTAYLTMTSTKYAASFMGAIYGTISALYVKLTSGHDFITIVIVAFCANLAGIMIVKIVIEKTQKEMLWIYNITFRETEEQGIGQLELLLKDNGLKILYNHVDDNLYIIQVFVSTKEESRIVKDIIRIYKLRYYAVESKTEGKIL